MLVSTERDLLHMSHLA